LLGVPEPSTWVMMILGFAGLAFAGYRSSRKSAMVPSLSRPCSHLQFDQPEDDVAVALIRPSQSCESIRHRGLKLDQRLAPLVGLGLLRNVGAIALNASTLVASLITPPCFLLGAAPRPE
jgi:hypothetical protein